MLHGQVIGTFRCGVGTTPLTITFNQNAMLDDVQAVARSITVRSIGHFAHQTGVAFQFSDGSGGIGTATTATMVVATMTMETMAVRIDESRAVCRTYRDSTSQLRRNR